MSQMAGNRMSGRGSRENEGGGDTERHKGKKRTEI